jgi:hypothetical protein
MEHTTQNAESQNRPFWVHALIGIAAVLLAGLVAAPLSLSAQDIMKWAQAGLGLHGTWTWIVFYALDASAIISVLICVYSAWNGKRAPFFQVAVWAIAGLSAFAQYKHGMTVRAESPDSFWFFPAMALGAPGMVEGVLAEVRANQRAKKGQVAKQMPKFGLLRWIPGVGSFVETYGSWRIARLLNIPTYEEAVSMYRKLCPNGGMRVLAAVRKYQDQMRTPEQVKQNTSWAKQIERPERRIVNLNADRNADQKYITAIQTDPAFPELITVEAIQNLVAELDGPNGTCGKSRAIRLRNKAKEQS